MFTSNPFAALSASIAASGHAELHRRHDRPGRRRHAVRRRPQGQRQVLLRQLANMRKTRAPQPVSGGELVSIAVKTGRRGRPRLRRILQPAPPHRPPAHHVRVRPLRRHHRPDGLRYPTPAPTRPLGAALVARRPDGLRRRLLVLVLHPRRRRRRGQLALARDARRPVHPVAARQRHAGPPLGLAAAGGECGRCCFGLYLIATTVLFGRCTWSKFAHMFFKPAAAFEKRVSKANGTSANLPTQTRDDPAQRERHSMELLRDAPMDMGLGIKREAPRHY